MPLRSLELQPRMPGLERTLVLMHGYGADEHDLLPIAHELDPRLRAVSLQAPLSLGGGQRAWFQLSQDVRGSLAFDVEQARAGVQAALEAVEDVAKKSPRPLLLGFSQGAAMAVNVALLRPDLIGGVLSLSGVRLVVQENERAATAALRDFPLFAAHGTLDPLLPIAMGRAMRDELVRLGLAVDWHEYEMGHMVVPEELADARAWLKQRI